MPILKSLRILKLTKMWKMRIDMFYGQRLSSLKEIKASELSANDYLLVSDMSEQVSKKMSVVEFLQYLRRHIDETQSEWRCLRCNSMVDMEKFRCQCTESPSP